MTKYYSQTNMPEALTAVFTSAARVAVLRIFMLDPRRAYYQRQIEAATGLALRAIQRELERFASVGLLYRRMEGNRAYYQVDMDFPLFPELRGMVMKTGSVVDQLRGHLALDEAVRLAFLSKSENRTESENRVLVVTVGEDGPACTAPDPYEIEVMTSEEFLAALTENPKTLEPFLGRGVDLLGRRDDVIWRRIETAGFSVEKGKGIP